MLKYCHPQLKQFHGCGCDCQGVAEPVGPLTQLRGHSKNPGCRFYKTCCNGRACIKNTISHFLLKVFRRELCVWHRSLCVLQCSPVRAQAGVGVDWIHYRLLGQFLLHKLIKTRAKGRPLWGQAAAAAGDCSLAQKRHVPVFSSAFLSKKGPIIIVMFIG